MNVNVNHSLVAVAVAAVLAAPAAYATNGYFKEGYGTKNRGMAGAGIAFSQDALAPATNPAGITQTGNRMDFGLELFNPNRDASLDATGMFGADTGKVDSGATLFAIPNAGFVFNMGNISTGVSISANGGMNTRYNSNLYANAFGPAIGVFAGVVGGMAPTVAAGLGANPNAQPYSTLGVNLAQVIIAPTAAVKLNQDHSIGGSLLVGYQSFRSYGLGLFQGLSSNGANVTNKGNDDAWGAGVRLGWTGDITSNITLGAQYSSKIYMQEFDHYAGLFAEQGDFDIPSNFGVGIAVKMAPETTVAFDVQEILYGDVAAIANKGPTADQFFGALASVLGSGMPYSGAGSLGTDAGWGFGWEDTTVFKLGVNHELNSQWTVRGGLNYSTATIDEDQNLFNILAPGIVQKHVALGFTYMPTQYSEISMTYMHAFREEQAYTFTATPALGPFAGANYTPEIGMDQNALEISYGMKF
jgi:long-chain fatty acid transport protein